MLQVSGLSFDYEDRPLLNEVQFAIAPGNLLHLRGQNGAGKTTLMKLLAGLLAPHHGHIYFENELIQRNLANYQQHICYVGHKSGLNGQLTVRENYRFGLMKPNQLIHFEQYAKQFSLEDQLDKPCAQLSMGQRRRASLLRLLLSDAPLWLLDEPFIGLDKQAVTGLIQLMTTHVNQQGIVVMTSHQDLPSISIPIQEYVL